MKYRAGFPPLHLPRPISPGIDGRGKANNVISTCQFPDRFILTFDPKRFKY